MPLFASRPARASLLLLASLAARTFAEQAQTAIPNASGQHQSSSSPDPQTSAIGKLPTLFLIGNSVPHRSALSASDPLAAFFDRSRINLVDRTMADPSSRAHLTEDIWKNSLALIKSGDIVLFQIAEPVPTPLSDTSRVSETLPGIGDEIREVSNPSSQHPEIIHTYGWYLRMYLVETIAKGAIPILCSTPTPTSDSTPPRDQDTYSDWARQIALQQRVTFLDLDAATQSRDLSKSAPSSGLDSSNSSDRTAPFTDRSARSIVAALKGLPNDPLAGYFSAKAAAIKPILPPQTARDSHKRSPDMPSSTIRPATSF
jgi:rhamnogalacturonan acetylesterase